MATSGLHLQAVALAVLLFHLAPATPASAQQPPGCPDKCGDISIPYPFGIGARCARDEGFQLDCDNNDESPPRLVTSHQFEQQQQQQLVSLSLADGEARVLLKPESKCYPVPETSINGSTTYRYSATKNRLVALG
ncbi:hypothetical protein E2562_018549 [Oryza meyeriana var. granulata]|uniref:Wall-associated receptor kinase galacturonan-binding domain-containing protein n=1 Tax=Oryza meyeriana var. granulata TaxID=110450 RepID=A0A6G1F9D6_9ORYZ|nr:hypothetical protein E2562_018549 [Oryza meyeriana var. granulata]